MQVAFRVDAGIVMGAGHVMRCLAIAQAFRKEKINCIFLVGNCPEHLVSRIQSENFAVVHLLKDDETELQQLTAALHVSMIIVDGYHFGPEYREQLRAIFGFLVLIDDYVITAPYHADVIVNALPNINREKYNGFQDKQLLLGIDYLAIRQEFVITTKTRADSMAASDRILLTFGGTDPSMLSMPVTEALLAGLPENVLFDLVIHDAHPDKEALMDLHRQYPEKLFIHVNAEDMSILMKQAAMAVSAAGSTLWELAVMQVPVVPVIIADNQKVVREYQYWPEPVNCLTPDKISCTEKIVSSACELWQDLESRASRVEKLGRLNLKSGANRICNELIQLYQADSEYVR